MTYLKGNLNFTESIIHYPDIVALNYSMSANFHGNMKGDNHDTIGYNQNCVYNSLGCKGYKGIHSEPFQASVGKYEPNLHRLQDSNFAYLSQKYGYDLCFVAL